MSIEQAQAFFEKVKNDEDLAKKLSEAQDNESKLEIARQEGFEFELEDAKVAMSALTSEDLERVAAGRGLVDSQVDHLRHDVRDFLESVEKLTRTE